MSNLQPTIRIKCVFLVHLALICALEINLLAQESKIELTLEEAQWLKSNSVIKFTGDPNWLPFEAFDANSKTRREYFYSKSTIGRGVASWRATTRAKGDS